MHIDFKGLRLRSSSEADLAFVCGLESDTDNSKFITPWSPDRHSEAFSDIDVFHGIILNANQPVGFIILAGLNNPNESIEFTRVVIGEKGKGLGRKTLQAVKVLCFEHLKAHRLWLDVKAFNSRAKHLYESEGFKIEGTLRDCLKVGDQYESLIILSMLQDEFQRS